VFARNFSTLSGGIDRELIRRPDKCFRNVKSCTRMETCEMQIFRRDGHIFVREVENKNGFFWGLQIG